LRFQWADFPRGPLLGTVSQHICTIGLLCRGGPLFGCRCIAAGSSNSAISRPRCCLSVLPLRFFFLVLFNELFLVPLVFYSSAKGRGGGTTRFLTWVADLDAEIFLSRDFWSSICLHLRRVQTLRATFSFLFPIFARGVAYWLSR